MFGLFFFESICYPCIFTLGTKNLGKYTKRGSGLIVMVSTFHVLTLSTHKVDIRVSGAEPGTRPHRVHWPIWHTLVGRIWCQCQDTLQ